MRLSVRMLLAPLSVLVGAGCGSSSTGEQADPTTPATVEPAADPATAPIAEPAPTDTTSATPAPTPTPTPTTPEAQPAATTAQGPVTDAEGWTVFPQPVTITTESAAGVTPGGATPEDAVAHFYASRIRRDRRWQDVVPPARGRSRNLTRALRELDAWRYFSVRIEAKKCESDTTCGIRIHMEVEVEGDRDTGTDQVGVERVDGRWFVTQPPM